MNLEKKVKYKLFSFQGDNFKKLTKFLMFL